MALAWANGPVGAQSAGQAGTATGNPIGLHEGTQQGGTRTEPVLRLFGIPLALNAPVTPPYCTCAMSTFAGQPVTGRTAVGLQATRDTP